MKLYKNVDIMDLENILNEGILSLDDSNNNNWLDNKRADNATDVVYLFKPLKENQTATNYGIVLLEVDVEATYNEMSEYDNNLGIYEEYVTKKVEVEEIKNIFIPRIFKERLEIEFPFIKNVKVTWIEMKFDYYQVSRENIALVEATEEIQEIFSKTAVLTTNYFNYFRGVYDNHEMLDVRNIEYVGI